MHETHGYQKTEQQSSSSQTSFNQSQPLVHLVSVVQGFASVDHTNYAPQSFYIFFRTLYFRQNKILKFKRHQFYLFIYYSIIETTYSPKQCLWWAFCWTRKHSLECVVWCCCFYTYHCNSFLSPAFLSLAPPRRFHFPETQLHHQNFIYHTQIDRERKREIVKIQNEWRSEKEHCRTSNGEA